ncbi:MAG: tetraacyldisaccharide 4'-kinase [Candidatus Cryptobacteroides sp.]
MLYRLVLKLRHRAYDKGRKKSEKAVLPTVCIGNVTVGGTGKTPHTELCLRMLAGVEGVAVLSGGYGRKSKGFLKVNPEGRVCDFGDEPLQIARKFPERVVAVDKDRLEGCRKLKEDFGASLVILDDAFQYRKLKADLNVVLVNYSRPVFEDCLLPFGRLRDLPERIFQADMLIVSKCPQDISEEEKKSWKTRLRLEDKNIPLLFSYIHYLPPKMVFKEGDPRYIYSQRILYMSGIAKDKRLFRQLSGSYHILKSFEFADHHDFSRKDLAKVEKTARKAKACAIATTEKDAQRLLSCDFVSDYLKERIFMVPVEARFCSPEDEALFSLRLKELGQTGI